MAVTIGQVTVGVELVRLTAEHRAILDAALTIKDTGGAVEIAGLRITPCDEYGREVMDGGICDDGACCAEDRNDPGTDWGITPQALADAMAGIDPDRSTVAAEAQSLVYGDRNDGYGHPRQNHTRISQLWTALLSDKLADGEYVTPEDVARCMVALKLARDVNTPKRDNRVDGIGYLIALDRMETGL